MYLLRLGKTNLSVKYKQLQVINNNFYETRKKFASKTAENVFKEWRLSELERKKGFFSPECSITIP